MNNIKRHKKWLRKKRKALKKLMKDWNPYDFSCSFDIFMEMLNCMGEYYYLGDGVFAEEIEGHDRRKTLLQLRKLYFDYQNSDDLHKLDDIFDYIKKECYFWWD